jgi:hypothetical protein
VTASLSLPIGTGPIISPGNLLIVMSPVVMLDQICRNVRLNEGDVLLLITSSLYRLPDSILDDHKFGWVSQADPRFDIVCMFLSNCQILTGIFVSNDLKEFFRRI